MFLEGEICILNKLAIKGLPNRIGERCIIVENNYKSANYDYMIEFDNGKTAPVKEIELNKLTDSDKQYMEYIFTGNTVIHKSSEVKVKILKVDYLLGQAEVEFSDDHSTNVVRFNNLVEAELESDSVEDESKQGKFTEIALEIGKFTDMKNKQYGSSVDATQKMIEVLMERYTYDDENYLMPKSLLQHILLQVRMMDKQNRIFNNPSGKGDSESPYRDLGGYSLIGIEMTEK